MASVYRCMYNVCADPSASPWCTSCSCVTSLVLVLVTSLVLVHVTSLVLAHVTSIPRHLSQDMLLQCWNCIVVHDMDLTVGAATGETGFHCTDLLVQTEITDHILGFCVSLSTVEPRHKRKRVLPVVLLCNIVYVQLAEYRYTSFH